MNLDPSMRIRNVVVGRFVGKLDVLPIKGNNSVFAKITEKKRSRLLPWSAVRHVENPIPRKNHVMQNKRHQFLFSVRKKRIVVQNFRHIGFSVSMKKGRGRRDRKSRVWEANEKAARYVFKDNLFRSIFRLILFV
jgi:hypothetical protein